MLENYTPFKNLAAMRIDINGNAIELRQSFRSHIIYEQITGESFHPKGMTEVITFFYCVIMANAPALELDFDSFVNWLDDNPSTVGDFSEWMVESNRRQAAMSPKDDKKETATKKPTAKKKK